MVWIDSSPKKLHKCPINTWKDTNTVQKLEITKCSPPDEWINKMCVCLSDEYYLVIERNEVGVHAAAWKNLENMMLS